MAEFGRGRLSELVFHYTEIACPPREIQGFTVGAVYDRAVFSIECDKCVSRKELTLYSAD
jgi:hypothetical protein